MKKIVALFLCLVLCFSLMACGSETASKSNDKANTTPDTNVASSTGTSTQEPAAASRDADGNGRVDKITYALNADPVNLLPWDSKANNKKIIYCAIYDSLFDFIDGEYVPNIATGYTEIDDLHWEVKMNENVYDWEGNHMTSSDVVFCYNNYINSGYAVKFDNFAGIEAKDEYTLEFTWVAPNTSVAGLDHVLTNVQLYCEAAWSEAGFANNPVATGPYKLVNYTSGSKVVIEANDDYWNAGKGTYIRAQNADVIEFDIIAESSQNVIGLQTASLDFSANIPSENFAEFAADSNYNTISRPTTEINVLFANCDESSPLHDKNLRLALFYAIDGESLAKAVPGTEACKGFSSSAAPDYVAKWDTEKTYFNTYDVDKAKELLEASDYDGTKLKFLAQNTEAMKTIVQMVQVFWQQIGVECDIEMGDGSTVSAKSSQLGTWDVMLSTAGGSFLVNAMNRLYNNREFGGDYCNGFIRDEKLQELYMAASDAATWGEDTIDALYQHICENGYHYTVLYQTATAVASNVFNEFVFWDGVCIPNACTYNVG